MGLACALALSPAVAVAQPSDAAALDRELDAAIARYHLPGLAVGVVKDGQVVYRGTRGEL